MIGELYVILLFLFGACVGSYLNVVAVRYSPEEGFRRSNTGRSHCPYCRHALSWYELIPILSFLIQGGRCRRCHEKLSFQYPAVEVAAGLAAASVPFTLGWGVPAFVWTLAFFIFIVVFLIDLRLHIIPDVLSGAIALLGVVLVAYRFFSGAYGAGLGIEGTFIGNYALIFWFWGENVLINHALGALFGLLFFWLIYFLTGGKAMGFGDVKLAGAVGMLLGWPDGALALVFAFILGAILGLALIGARRRAMKDMVPFGPFIVLGVAVVFFFGYDIVNGYFELFNLVP